MLSKMVAKVVAASLFAHLNAITKSFCHLKLQLGLSRFFTLFYHTSEITPCNKIDKPLIVNRLSGNVMTSLSTLHTIQNYNV